jgi:hypothetical protein
MRRVPLLLWAWIAFSFCAAFGLVFWEGRPLWAELLRGAFLFGVLLASSRAIGLVRLGKQ